MDQTDLLPTENTSQQETVGKPSRLFFIDNLRTALVILVVLHHVSLVYGASVEGYYYVEPPFSFPQAFVALMVFVLVNQAWFMGAFFLLAGYFTPGSFDRRGAGSFLKERLLRLGIPILLFYFALSPISYIGYFLMPAEITGNTAPLAWETFWQAYPEFIGIGPLWFVALLLIFSFGYAGWRRLPTNRNQPTEGGSSFPGYGRIALFILLLWSATFLLRKVIPIGKSVWEFPTLAYLPQYLGFFIIGIVASRGDWLRKLSASMGLVGFIVALVAGAILYPLAFSGKLFSMELTPEFPYAMGYGTWRSAVYILWDSIFAVGISMGLITFFRRFFNGDGKFGRFLSRHGYVVYIIHIPIVVFITYALRGIELAPVLKFGLASVIIIPACFAAAFIVRKIPFASKIL
jgi:hypothetical protein